MEHIVIIDPHTEPEFPGKAALSMKDYQFSFFSEAYSALGDWAAMDKAGVLVSFESIKFDAVAIIRQIKLDLETGPLIVYSTNIDEFDTILALEAGADEVITGTMEEREAQSRVLKTLNIYKKLLTNEADTGFTAQECIRIEEFTICLGNFKFLKNDQIINLTSKEFLLLMLLYKNRGEIVTREEVIDEWKSIYNKTSENSRISDIFVNQLRKKIGLNCSTAFNIVTVYEKGYSFKFNNPLNSNIN